MLNREAAAAEEARLGSVRFAYAVLTTPSSFTKFIPGAPDTFTKSWVDRCANTQAMHDDICLLKRLIVDGIISPFSATEAFIVEAALQQFFKLNKLAILDTLDDVYEECLKTRGEI